MTTMTENRPAAGEKRAVLRCPGWWISDHSLDLRNARTHPRQHQIRHLDDDVLKDWHDLEATAIHPPDATSEPHLDERDQVRLRFPNFGAE